MTTCISFSRTAIASNIAIGRNRIANRPPSGEPLAPIRVKEGDEPEYSTFGLQMEGPAEVVYNPHAHPLTYIETDHPIRTVEKLYPDDRSCWTIDRPRSSNDSRYVYIQLVWLRGNEMTKWRDRPPLPVLTGRWWCKNLRRLQPRCAYRIHVTGAATISYSLGLPIFGNKHEGKDSGVRLWLQTDAHLEPVATVDYPAGWYPAKLSRATFDPRCVS